MATPIDLVVELDKPACDGRVFREQARQCRDQRAPFVEVVGS